MGYSSTIVRGSQGKDTERRRRPQKVPAESGHRSPGRRRTPAVDSRRSRRYGEITNSGAVFRVRSGSGPGSPDLACTTQEGEGEDGPYLIRATGSARRWPLRNPLPSVPLRAQAPMAKRQAGPGLRSSEEGTDSPNQPRRILCTTLGRGCQSLVRGVAGSRRRASPALRAPNPSVAGREDVRSAPRPRHTVRLPHRPFRAAITARRPFAAPSVSGRDHGTPSVYRTVRFAPRGRALRAAITAHRPFAAPSVSRPDHGTPSVCRPVHFAPRPRHTVRLPPRPLRAARSSATRRGRLTIVF